VRFIDHKGQRILLIDFSRAIVKEDVLHRIGEARTTVAGQPPGSLLTLTNVEGAFFNREIIQAIMALVEHNKPYAVAAALVGVSGLMQVFLNTIRRVSGRRFASFDSIEAAKDWLVEQERAARQS
jgi:uncharacterized Fe-S cluster-containing radical SAM superfamily protein